MKMLQVDARQFWDAVEKTERATLSTCAGGLVTARTISPMAMEQRVVFYTSGSSTKARQIGENTHVALSFGNYNLTGTAEILGRVDDPALLRFREGYIRRYPGAFDPKDPTLSGDEVFIAVKPGEVSCWIYEDEIPVGFARSNFS